MSVAELSHCHVIEGLHLKLGAHLCKSIGHACNYFKTCNGYYILLAVTVKPINMSSVSLDCVDFLSSFAVIRHECLRD